MGAQLTGAKAVGAFVRWRLRQLLDAGFELPLASVVARDSAYDLHALIELAERGCPPELAVRILTPIADSA